MPSRSPLLFLCVCVCACLTLQHSVLACHRVFPACVRSRVSFPRRPAHSVGVGSSNSVKRMRRHQTEGGGGERSAERARERDSGGSARRARSNGRERASETGDAAVEGERGVLEARGVYAMWGSLLSLEEASTCTRRPPPWWLTSPDVLLFCFVVNSARPCGCALRASTAPLPRSRV